MVEHNKLAKVSLIEVIDASLDNGERLLDDARLLLDSEKAPTAYALCILAQEEFAKAFFLYLVDVNCIPGNTIYIYKI